MAKCSILGPTASRGGAAEAGPDCSEGGRYSHRFATQFLIFFLLARPAREDVFRELDEEYRSVVVGRFGIEAATAWYWKQVARSVGPVAFMTTRKILLRNGVAFGGEQERLCGAFL